MDVETIPVVLQWIKLMQKLWTQSQKLNDFWKPDINWIETAQRPSRFLDLYILYINSDYNPL